MSRRARRWRRPLTTLLALGFAPTLAIAGCDGDGRARVDVVEADPAARAAAGSGATYGVVAQLRTPEGAERVVYAPPVDLRRPPGAEAWPPTAEEWPGPRTTPDTEEESARAAATEPTEPRDTAAADTAGAGPADAAADTGAGAAQGDTAPAPGDVDDSVSDTVSH